MMGARQIVGDKFLREFGGYPDKDWQRRGEKCVAEFWGKNRCATAGVFFWVGWVHWFSGVRGPFAAGE